MNPNLDGIFLHILGSSMNSQDRWGKTTKRPVWRHGGQQADG